MNNAKRFVQAAKTDALLDGLGESVKNTLNVSVDIPGRLDMTLLHDALMHVASTSPELAARYRPGFFRSVWEVDQSPEWLLVEYQDVDIDRAQKLEAELVAAPFHTSGELPISLRLLHMNDMDRLLLRVNHLFVDGGGTKLLLYQLARAYRSLKNNLPYEPLPGVGRPRPRNTWRVFRALRLRNIMSIIRGYFAELSALMKSPPAFFVPMSTDGVDVTETQVATLKVDAARVERLKARWQGTKVTINDMLLAAFTRALEGLYGNVPGQREHMGMVVTSDLRKHLPPENHLTNLSVMCLLSLASLPFAAPAEHLVRVAQVTERWKRNGSGLGLALSMAWAHLLPDGFLRSMMQKMMSRDDPSVCRIVFTNIGQIDETLLDFGDGPCLDAKISPPVSLPPGLATGATGCAGSVTFSVGYRPAAFERTEAALVLSSLDKELERLE